MAYSYFEILSVAVVILFGLYYYFTSTYDYWKSRGVVGPRPVPGFGNIKDLILGKLSVGDTIKKIYDEYKNEPMIGIFARRTPLLILNDPELIKNVLIRDFSKFSDRGLKIHERMEPLSQNLVNLEPARWRPLRTSLSPIFTSGKLKEMFHLILQSSTRLEKYLEKLVEKKEPVECRELTAKFTTDVIGNCAFGIEMNALTDEDSEFRKMGREVFNVTKWRLIKIRIRESVPWFYDLMGYVLPQTKVTKFFTGLIAETMDYRKKNNYLRHDFVDILIELERNPEKLKGIELTDTLLAAQAFVFFVAGFETSSTTMSHALYELALNPDIQKKLREEIREQYSKNNGDLKYENVKEMKYLDKVFRETLRKYPPAMLLVRKSIENYTFEGTKVSIPKGTRVWIPLYAMHRDSAIYPDPEVFDPERFDDSAAATRNPMHYLPFGDGPRNCIGARFAVYQSKIGLVKIIQNYQVEVCEKTLIPYVNDPNAFLLAPKGGIYLKISKVEN